MTRKFIKVSLVAVLQLFSMRGCLVLPSNVAAQNQSPSAVKSSGENQVAVQAEKDSDDARRRATAVALNLCRASFHRIRRYPSTRVLLEEREKILNNLNVNQIPDAEVIKLYSTVLDEIRDVQIADKERQFFNKRFKRHFRHRLAGNAFAFGTQLATAQYIGALRTGASSWWDYRELGMHRDIDLWRVDQKRMSSVVQKSTGFLDTFWKLAQKNDIPDRWLIRNADLERFETALSEKDPEVRLRVLNRMENFMECYPPYWYHVARTQQALGQAFAAIQTYERLETAGTGHFRKDDMLATALANQAALKDYLGQPGAAVVAKRALKYSTDEWEANLMCARILERHGLNQQAEDAIFRNLDVNLEQEQSNTALATLYFRTKDTTKLAKHLDSKATLRGIPVPVLLQCCALLDGDGMPTAVRGFLAESFMATPHLQFGYDDLDLVALPAWFADHADVSIEIGDKKFAKSEIVDKRGQVCRRFRRIIDLGNPLNPQPKPLPNIVVHLKYPDVPAVRLALVRQTSRSLVVLPKSTDTAQPPTSLIPRRRDELRLASVEMDQVRISLKSDELPDRVSLESSETEKSTQNKSLD